MEELFVDVHFGVGKLKGGSIVNQELWRFGKLWRLRMCFPEMGGHLLDRAFWIGTVGVQELSV